MGIELEDYSQIITVEDKVDMIYRIRKLKEELEIRNLPITMNKMKHLVVGEDGWDLDIEGKDYAM